MYEKYYSAQYLSNDKVIFTKEPKMSKKEVNIGTTLGVSEQAYYFINLAFEYAKKFE